MCREEKGKWGVQKFELLFKATICNILSPDFYLVGCAERVEYIITDFDCYGGRGVVPHNAIFLQNFEEISVKGGGG